MSVKVDIALAAAAVVMSVGSNFVKGPANAATMHCCLQRRLNLDRCKGLLENGRTMMMDEIRSMWLGKERRGNAPNLDITNQTDLSPLLLNHAIKSGSCSSSGFNVPRGNMNEYADRLSPSGDQMAKRRVKGPHALPDLPEAKGEEGVGRLSRGKMALFIAAASS